MSDGAPNDEYQGMQEVERIKKEKWISKVQFLAVGFAGSQAVNYNFFKNFRVLEAMAKSFPNGKMQTASSVAELK